MDRYEVEQVRAGIKSLNDEVCRLLDICLGCAAPSNLRPVNHDMLSMDDLDNLTAMVETEMVAGVQACLDSPHDNAEKSDPKPFDLFLIKTRLEHIVSKRMYALCIPMNGKGLHWYDGFTEVLKLEDLEWDRRVGSLSGSARVLVALKGSSNMKAMAMRREGLINPLNFESIMKLDRKFQPFINNMNESQQIAVATVVHPSFDEGFFAIQGPPGCGSTSFMITIIIVLRLIFAQPFFCRCQLHYLSIIHQMC